MQIERELGVWELKLYMVNEISNDPSPGNCGVCSRRLYEAFYTKKKTFGNSPSYQVYLADRVERLAPLQTGRTV